MVVFPLAEERMRVCCLQSVKGTAFLVSSENGNVFLAKGEEGRNTQVDTVFC